MAIKISELQKLTEGFVSFKAEQDDVSAVLYEHAEEGDALKENGWLENNKDEVLRLLQIDEADFAGALKTIRTQLKKLLAD